MIRSFARKGFENLIAETIRHGTLVIEDPDGQRYQAGDGHGDKVHVRITDWKTVFRLALNPDLAVGEGYMDGGIVMV